MKHLLPKLAERLQQFYPTASKIQVPAFVSEIPEEDSPVISHAWFWPRLRPFFRSKDVIVTETGKRELAGRVVSSDRLHVGTANFGIVDVPLPSGAILLSQILWGSIGWSVGRLDQLVVQNQSWH